MVILYFVQLPNYLATTLMDGIIMIVLILPGLYFLHFRPLLQQMEERTQAEFALRTSETQLKRVLESLPIGVWIVDNKGNVLHGNPASQNIWAGVRYVGINQYAEYKGWWADTGKRIAPEEWAAARAITRGETSLDEEVIIEAFDGTNKIILNSAVPILDEQNSLQGVVVVNQDITQRRQMEKTLIQTNELMERLFSSIDTLIAYLDRDFNLVRVNDTYAKAAGHPPEYFTGKNHFDLYPSEENEAIFRRVVETGESFYVLEKPFEYGEYPERGVTYWDWSLQPVKENGGAVEGLVLSLVDVTERKRAEIQLAAQNEELLELANAEHKQRELAESLVQATIALSSSLQLEDVLNAILEQIHRAIPFQVADIALIENRTVRIAGYRAFDDHPEAIEAMNKTYALDNFPLWLKAHSTRQPNFIEDTRGFPDWQIVPGMEWVHSYAVAPLIAGDQVIGLINLTSDQPGFFNEEMTARLTAFAAHAALAIQNARLYMAELNARQAAEILSGASQALTKTLDLEQVIEALLEHIHDLVYSETAGVTLLEDETHLARRAVQGYGPLADQDNIPVFPITGITDSVIHRMIADRKSLTLPNITLYPPREEQLSNKQISNWLVVPIIANEKVIGLVELGRKGDENFNSVQIQWAEALVGQAAVAIQNAWLFQQVRSSSERLRSLARKLVEIQENERYHIARELHDEAGQALSLLKLNLGRLEQDPECPQSISERLEDLKGVVDGVLEELHRLAIDLRPIALDHLGLVAALEQYTKNLDTDSFAVKFKALGFEGDRLPKDMATSLYRIVQEAIANVIRHAEASNVGIILERGENRVKLFIEDDGIGFDPDQLEIKHRLGLVGMRERAEMLGGTLTVESSPGRGTLIIVEVPDDN